MVTRERRTTEEEASNASMRASRRGPGLPCRHSSQRAGNRHESAARETSRETPSAAVDVLWDGLLPSEGTQPLVGDVLLEEGHVRLKETRLARRMRLTARSWRKAMSALRRRIVVGSATGAAAATRHKRHARLEAV
jgi:hypothetical protein